MKPDEILVGDGGNSLIAMDGDKLPELEFAGYCAWFLTQCYPGHPWPVECQMTPDGMDIRIRHWALAPFGPYCYHIPPQHVHSPTTLHHHLKMGGGEILDRLGLSRVGGWDGQVPVSIDDVDERFAQKVYR